MTSHLTTWRGVSTAVITAYEGMIAGKSRVAACANDCPGAKLVLSGYIPGAHVLGNVLGGNGGAYTMHETVEPEVDDLTRPRRARAVIISLHPFELTQVTAAEPRLASEALAALEYRWELKIILGNSCCRPPLRRHTTHGRAAVQRRVRRRQEQQLPANRHGSGQDGLSSPRIARPRTSSARRRTTFRRTWTTFSNPPTMRRGGCGPWWAWRMIAPRKLPLRR